MNNKKKLGVLSSSLLLGFTLLTTSTVNAGSAYFVNNGNDSGSGTLRAGLDSNASIIIIDPSVDTITIDDTLTYNSAKPLMIVGSGQTIFGQDSANTLLEISHGADLTVANVNFRVDEEFNVNNQGGGKGIFINVPKQREGIVNLTLKNVSVSNVGQHGIHVLDCDAIDCGAGGGGAGEGSDASIFVKFDNVIVDNAGNGHFDSDGVRIDDRGEGDIVFHVTNSKFKNIGADGVELDEGDAGDVIINVRNTVFKSNGAYCDGVDVNNPADATCVEDDDGELVLDLDDGFDIDEAGEGSIVGKISNTKVKYNLDEGLDFDEEDEGGINISLVKVNASKNGDEGIKVSEEDDGDVNVMMRAVKTLKNNDDGIQLEQDHDGDINVKVNASISKMNKKYGLNVGQDGNGAGSLKVRGSKIDSIKSDVEEI